MVFDECSLPSAEERVEYLLLHLGTPAPQRPPSNKHVFSSTRAAKRMGVELRRISLNHGKYSPAAQRYMFSFPCFRRDDKIAIWIAESVIYAANITCYPFGDVHEPALVLPIPVEMSRNIVELTIHDLCDLEDRRAPHLRSVEYPAATISSATSMLDHCVSAAWTTAMALFERRDLHKAARFLKESQDEFYIWPGQYSAVLADGEAAPQSGWERTRLENGLLLAFKSTEALVGDPPKDDRKLKRKIRAIGADPEELMGYPDQVCLCEYIRKFARDRDTVAAHGSVGAADVKVRDLFLYQDCARHLVLSAIEDHLGMDLYS